MAAILFSLAAAVQTAAWETFFVRGVRASVTLTETQVIYGAEDHSADCGADDWQ